MFSRSVCFKKKKGDSKTRGDTESEVTSKIEVPSKLEMTPKPEVIPKPIGVKLGGGRSLVVEITTILTQPNKHQMGVTLLLVDKFLWSWLL